MIELGARQISLYLATNKFIATTIYRRITLTASSTFLAIIRADIKLRPKWDILGEYRFLSTPDANSDQAGALVGIYRRFNENLRAGIGYNATDFSDDLTNQSYSSEGLFFNAIGKF